MVIDQIRKILPLHLVYSQHAISVYHLFVIIIVIIIIIFFILNTLCLMTLGTVTAHISAKHNIRLSNINISTQKTRIFIIIFFSRFSNVIIFLCFFYASVVQWHFHSNDNWPLHNNALQVHHTTGGHINQMIIANTARHQTILLLIINFFKKISVTKSLKIASILRNDLP